MFSLTHSFIYLLGFTMAQVSALVITSFHKDVFNAANACAKAQITLGAKLATLIAKQYPSKSPSFEQYRADQSALAELCKEKGLVDNQYYRKAYAVAIKLAFNEVPVSMDAAAIAKRKARDAKKAADTKGKSGAVKGDTSKRAPSVSETVEQMIARVGVFKVLEMCANILDADESTKTAAKALKGIKAA
jgi:hypothetical protein